MDPEVLAGLHTSLGSRPQVVVGCRSSWHHLGWVVVSTTVLR